MIEALRKITSPSVANAIETFKVRARSQGQMSSEVRALFPELGPLVGYAVTAVIRAEPEPLEGHRASTFGWWAAQLMGAYAITTGGLDTAEVDAWLSSLSAAE